MNTVSFQKSKCYNDIRVSKGQVCERKGTFVANHAAVIFRVTKGFKQRLEMKYKGSILDTGSDSLRSPQPWKCKLLANLAAILFPPREYKDGH